MNRLNKVGIKVKLDILGPSIEELSTTERGVSVHGWVERKQLEAISSKAGLLLVPSTHEGMPLAVLDALASGLPCLVSKTSAEFIGRGGKVVDSLEPSAWADAIQSIIEDNDEWRRMCQEAPLAVQELDSESNRIQWGELYDSIMQSDSRLGN